MTDLVTLYLTADSEDVAVHISTALVKERLVACANINRGTRSIFEWNGILQLENEVTVFFKTTADKADAAIARAKELHTYDTPCIVAWPITHHSEEYAAWVKAQTVAGETSAKTATQERQAGKSQIGKNIW